MKITFRSLLPLFLIAVAAASVVILISSSRAATAHGPDGSELHGKNLAVDSAEQQAVLAPITKMFGAMAKRDAAAFKKQLLSGGTTVLMRDGKPTQMTLEQLADLVAQPGPTQIEERIHDPLVRVDHDLAVVWAPFEFLVDGKVDHCGTDLFTLARTDGNWVVAAVADTGRKDCVGR